jgi:hypothetical protein
MNSLEPFISVGEILANPPSMPSLLDLEKQFILRKVNYIKKYFFILRKIANYIKKN